MTTAPELRATAGALILIAFGVYIQGDSAPGTERTLSYLGGFNDWGWFLITAGVAALVLSFLSPRWLRRGHLLIMFTAGVWATFLALGFIDGRASWGGAASVGIFSLLAFVSARCLRRE